MRHNALKTVDITRAKKFCHDLLERDIVLEPDWQNVDSSSGCDKIALHKVSMAHTENAAELMLDHLGFVFETFDGVGNWRSGSLQRVFGSSLHPFRIQRDGSASYDCVDPDGIVIQMLYVPTLSKPPID